jgi:hypothetical protein
MKKIITLLLLGLSCSFIQAESVPWISALGSFNPSITIPAGKVFIIHNVSPLSNTNIKMRFSGSYTGGVTGNAATFDAPFTFGNVGTGGQQLTAPIRVGPGMTITWDNGAPFTIFATVMDSTDYLASGQPTIRSVTHENGILTAVVDSKTTQPNKVTPEVSSNLQNWIKAGATVAQSSSNTRMSIVKTSVDAVQKYLRVQVKNKPDLVGK